MIGDSIENVQPSFFPTEPASDGVGDKRRQKFKVLHSIKIVTSKLLSMKKKKTAMCNTKVAPIGQYLARSLLMDKSSLFSLTKFLHEPNLGLVKY